MTRTYEPTPPSPWTAIERDTKALAFTMASDVATGAFLRTLAASKPGGALLEMGTGTGLAEPAAEADSPTDIDAPVGNLCDSESEPESRVEALPGVLVAPWA